MWHSIGIQCRGKWKYNFFWKYLESILFIFFYCFLQLHITNICVRSFFFWQDYALCSYHMFLPFSKRICTHHFRNQSWAIVFCIAPQTNTQQICLALQSRITYQTISKLTFFMKVLHFSLLYSIIWTRYFVYLARWRGQLMSA